MSQMPEPHRIVDGAIHESIRLAYPGDLVTGWLMIASTLPEGMEGGQCYRWLAGENQTLHASIGLVAILKRDLYVVLENGARGAG